MSPLDPDLKRVIACARQVPAEPVAPLPPGLATRVLASVRSETPEVVSTRLLGGIMAVSAALAVVWALVFLDNSPAGSEQTFNEIATRMVTRVGR